MNKLDEELLDAIFDKTLAYEELEEMFFSVKSHEDDENFLETWLEQENLTYETAIQQRENKRNRLLELGRKLGLPLDNSFQTCKRISESEKISLELEEFLSLFLSEQGNLLKPSDDLTENELLTDYALYFADYQKTKHLLSTLESLRQNWFITKGKIFDKVTSNLQVTNVTREEILKICTAVFGVGKSSDIFAYNLDVLLGEINHLEAHRTIAPLYIYQVIVNHFSRLQKNKDMTINQKSLWSNKEYEIQVDNGRNFNKNRQYLNFFERLCSLFQKDSSVNIPLSRWGFMLLSNLVEFQRAEQEDKLDGVFPYIDEIIDASFFSCFGYNEKEAVVLKGSGYSLKQVEYFRSVSSYRNGLDKISLYMNQNALQILAAVEESTPEKIKNLCTDILLNSKLNAQDKPKTQRELELYLCAINLGILDIIDYYAKEYLVLGWMNILRNECTIP